MWRLKSIREEIKDNDSFQKIYRVRSRDKSYLEEMEAGNEKKQRSI